MKITTVVLLFLSSLLACAAVDNLCDIHITSPVVTTSGSDISFDVAGDAPDSVNCVFDGVVVDAVVSGSVGRCRIPRYDNDVEFDVDVVVSAVTGSQEQCTASVIISLHASSNASVTPSVAHNTTTNITLCGLTYYDWSEPRCVFESTVYVNASWINSTCITCRYYSSSPCEMFSVTDVAAVNDIETINGTVTHVCIPRIFADVMVFPPRIVLTDVIRPDFVSVTGAGFFDSDCLLCEFGDEDHVTIGTTVSGYIAQCPIPPRDDVMRVMLRVSNDCGQTFVNTTMFEYSDGTQVCDGEYCTCRPGYYMDEHCMPCPIGQYGDGDGDCTPCPNNFITEYGASVSRDDCVCAPGYYAVKNTTTVLECKRCNVHADCAGGTSVQSALPGHYLSDDDVIVTCIPRDACDGDGTCADGYEGERCSRCRDGYYRRTSGCMECSRTLPLWISMSIICVVILLFIGLLMLRAFRGHASLAAISIAISYIQVFSLVSHVHLSEPFTYIFNVLHVNVEYLGLACEYDMMDYYGHYIANLCIPLVVMVMVAVCVVIVALLWKRLTVTLEKSSGELSSATVSVLIVLSAIMYTPLSSFVLSYVSCTSLENGAWVLDASPDIECFGTEHLNNLWIFVIGMIVYVIGIPVVFLYIILHNRSIDDEEYSRTHLIRYGFILMKYRDDVYWYEMVVMARKVMTVLSFAVWVPSIRLTMASIVMTIAVVIQCKQRPYVLKTLNDLDCDSMLINVITLICVGAMPYCGTLVTWVLLLLFIMSIITVIWRVVSFDLHYVERIGGQRRRGSLSGHLQTLSNTMMDDFTFR